MNLQVCPRCGVPVVKAVGSDGDYMVLVAVCPACFTTAVLEVLWRGKRVVLQEELR